MTVALSDGRVAIITSQYGSALGGVERYVERLAVGLSARGLQVDVLTLADRLAPALEIVDGVTVRRFAAMRIAGDAMPSVDLYRWLVSSVERYSVLNVHNLHSVLPALAGVASRRIGVPVVLTPHWHGTGHTTARRLLHLPYRPVAMWAARAADAVICNSNAEQDLVKRQLGPRNRVVVIPEGVEVPHRSAGLPRSGAVAQVRATTDDGITLLAVGRLERYKGTEAIVRALPHLPLNYRLVVIGTGPALGSITGTAIAERVSDRVDFLGPCTDEELGDWYDQAAVCVSLSAQESFGLVVLEAAAAGCPVVVSDIGAHRELISFVPRDRFAFVPRDASPQTLALAIADAVRFGRVAKVDQTISAGWRLPTWEHLVDEAMHLFAEVAAARRSR